MRRRGEQRRWRRGARGLVLGALGSAVCTLALAGCQTRAQQQAPSYDPLVGGPPLPAGSAAPAPPQSSTSSRGTLPPLPPPASSTSPAALTTGATQSLDPNRELRIGTPVSNPGPGNGPANVLLRGPEPSAPPPPPSSAAGVTTYEQAQGLLQARGVVWQRLETGSDPGDWKFSCSVPNRQNPNLHRTYEARARDPIAALRAALEQMERE